VPNLYTGLDQLIAKPTRAETAAVPVQTAEEPVVRQDTITPVPGTRQEETQKKPAAPPDTAGNLVRQLEPDPPDAPDLYRKQTINFGPDDLEAVQKMQDALRDLHKQEISKQDIVRAAVEFLLKDHELHKEDSFLVRKFVRR